jgi:hypothetical protein
MENAYKYIPSKPLQEGYYCFHNGRLTSGEPMAATVEANAKNDIFDFIVSKNFGKSKKLSTLDINAGQYTLTPDFGMYFIQNKEYVRVPIIKKENTIIYGGKKSDSVAIITMPITVINKEQIAKYWISTSKENARNDGFFRLKIDLSTVLYQDMIPERMILSKLKEVEIDSRSKKEIKNNVAPKIIKAWIEEKVIPYDIEFCWYSNPFIVKCELKEPLEPGVYAWHNGGLNGKEPTYRNYVIYDFVVK